MLICSDLRLREYDEELPLIFLDPFPDFLKSLDQSLGSFLFCMDRKDLDVNFMNHLLEEIRSVDVGIV